MSENRSLQTATSNSEDELFRILSRPSLYEMIGKYRELYITSNWTISDRSQLFTSNGWTLREFCEKHNELGIQLPHD